LSLGEGSGEAVVVRRTKAAHFLSLTGKESVEGWIGRLWKVKIRVEGRFWEARERRVQGCALRQEQLQ
jgi:hypothetical protein